MTAKENIHWGLLVVCYFPPLNRHAEEIRCETDFNKHVLLGGNGPFRTIFKCSTARKLVTVEDRVNKKIL